MSDISGLVGTKFASRCAGLFIDDGSDLAFTSSQTQRPSFKSVSRILDIKFDFSYNVPKTRIHFSWV